MLKRCFFAAMLILYLQFFTSLNRVVNLTASFFHLCHSFFPFPFIFWILLCQFSIVLFILYQSVVHFLICTLVAPIWRSQKLSNYNSRKEICKKSKCLWNLFSTCIERFWGADSNPKLKYFTYMYNIDNNISKNIEAFLGLMTQCSKAIHCWGFNLLRL